MVELAAFEDAVGRLFGQDLIDPDMVLSLEPELRPRFDELKGMAMLRFMKALPALRLEDAAFLVRLAGRVRDLAELAVSTARANSTSLEYEMLIADCDLIRGALHEAKLKRTPMSGE